MWLPHASATFWAQILAMAIHEVFFLVNNPWNNYSTLWALYITLRFFFSFGNLMLAFNLFTEQMGIDYTRRARLTCRLVECGVAVAFVIDDAAELSYKPESHSAFWVLQMVVGALAIPFSILGFVPYFYPRSLRFPSPLAYSELEEPYTDEDLQEEYSDEPLALAYQAQENSRHGAAASVPDQDLSIPLIIIDSADPASPTEAALEVTGGEGSSSQTPYVEVADSSAQGEPSSSSVTKPGTDHGSVPTPRQPNQRRFEHERDDHQYLDTPPGFEGRFTPRWHIPEVDCANFRGQIEWLSIEELAVRAQVFGNIGILILDAILFTGIRDTLELNRHPLRFRNFSWPIILGPPILSLLLQVFIYLSMIRLKYEQFYVICQLFSWILGCLTLGSAAYGLAVFWTGIEAANRGPSVEGLLLRFAWIFNIIANVVITFVHFGLRQMMSPAPY